MCDLVLLCVCVGGDCVVGVCESGGCVGVVVV